MSSRSSDSAAQHCGAAGWGGGRDLAFRSSRSGARLQSPYALSVLLARLKTWNRNLYGGLYGTRCCCCISDQSYTNKRYSPPASSKHLDRFSQNFKTIPEVSQKATKTSIWQPEAWSAWANSLLVNINVFLVFLIVKTLYCTLLHNNNNKYHTFVHRSQLAWSVRLGLTDCQRLNYCWHDCVTLRICYCVICLFAASIKTSRHSTVRDT